MTFRDAEYVKQLMNEIDRLKSINKELVEVLVKTNSYLLQESGAFSFIEIKKLIQQALKKADEL